MSKKAPKGDPTHRIMAFSLRMPPELREAIEAELYGYNNARELGSKARTLNEELVARLAGTLADSGPSSSTSRTPRKRTPRRKGGAK